MYQLIIVDDEMTICQGLAECYPWEEMGFEVAGTFQSGKKALDHITQHPVDAVLTDIKMPEMDGLELVKAVHASYPSVFCVILSGFADFEYAKTAIASGVKDYLLKPVDYDELIRVFTGIREELDILAGKEQLYEEQPGFYDAVINRVIAYVNTSYAVATLKDASLLVSLSPGYLSRIFQQKKKMSFTEYLISVKMRAAGELLKDITLKTYEVSEKVGYRNPKNFTRSFKNYYGITPNEYRKKSRESL